MKIKMAKLLVLLVVSLVILSGCAGEIQNKIDVPEDTTPNEQGLPNEIQDWVENSRNIFLGQTYQLDDKLYVLVTYGTKPTGGFGVEITEVRELDEAIEIVVDFTKPASGDMVTQAITYPYALVDMEATNKEVKFVTTGAEIHLPTLLGIDRLKPIVAGDNGVMIFGPTPDSQIKDGKVVFSGIANVYEGTVNFRIKSGSTVVKEGFVTGSMGDWGFFSETIDLPENVSGPISLEIYVVSPKDGQEMDIFDIPLDI